jgi:hypothetical protein
MTKNPYSSILSVKEKQQKTEIMKYFESELAQISFTDPEEGM